VRRLQFAALGAIATAFLVFLGLDLLLSAVLEDRNARYLVRWSVIGAVLAGLTFLANSRTVRMVVKAMTAERVARDEAEALANLAAVVASGKDIEDTLMAAVHATATLLGRGARSTIALPDEDGLLQVVAWTHESGNRIRRFRFVPGKDFVGRVYTERRLIGIPDLKRDGDREDVARVSDVRSMLAAPLVANDRTLGVLCVVWPEASAFGEREERVLTGVARHVAVALVATEARDAARREAAKKAAIFHQMVDAVLVADRTQTIVEANAAAARLFDLEESVLLGRTCSSVPWTLLNADGAEAQACRGPLVRACEGETVAADYRIITHSGLERWVSATASPLHDDDGNQTGGVLVLRDMAQWREAQAALRESEERYRRLVESCPDPIVVVCDGTVVYANAAAAELAGTDTPEQLFGRSMLEFIPDVPDHAMARLHEAATLESASLAQEREAVRVTGERIQIESTTMPITYGGRPAIQAVLRDITERKRAEAALAYQATHDALTGLPNRVLLIDRLEQALAAATRDGTPLSLLLMDLDRFKEVNDTLGHHAGDLLLQQVAMRLRGAVRQSDTIARLGGDEFAIILPGADAAKVVGVVETLLGRLHAPFTIELQPVVIGASIGVVVAPDHGSDADTLMRRADVAMYAAKRNGSGLAMYRPEIDRNTPSRLSLIGELRHAIEAGELVLHYQPKLDLATGAVAGVEALVRWMHPMRGMISPDQFIPVAEHAGLIEPLTRWVLRSALVQANAWRRMGQEIPVAVNLSMRSLHDQALPNTIADLLSVTRTRPSQLVLEITESSLMIDLPQTQAILARLREMGIRIAIDDFGTGHSSLAYLKRLPVDEIKIDRSFVQDMVTDTTDCVIVRATIELAHSLGLRVVAEGVEDEPTQTLLARLGCDEAQGFHLGRPLPGHALSQWLGRQAIAA
jgi:diguanylate cyclase (GGDEF)-like protein/PAS domain S-box-containing protein